MSASSAPAVRFVSAARRAWDRWWFAPTSPVPIGLFRIVFGMLVLVYAALLFPDRLLWFSEGGALTRADADRYNGSLMSAPRFEPLHGVVSDPGVTACLVVLMAAALMLTLGLWTRLSSLLVFVLLSYTYNRNLMIHHSGDMLMMVLSAYLVLAPAGAALSLDRWMRVRRGRAGASPPLAAPWVQRLMQLQVAAIYCQASLSKLGGSHWRDGTAAYYAIHAPDMTRFPVPWVDGRHLWLLHGLTWGTVAVEFSLWTLVWLPRTRLYALAAGVLLHLGIEYALNIPLFSFFMIASYLVFLTGADVKNFRRWAALRASPRGRPQGPSPALGVPGTRR